MKKKLLSVLLIGTMTLGCFAGCSSELKEENETLTKTKVSYDADDFKDIVTGWDDIYVLEGAENMNYLEIVEVADDTLVANISVDDSKVDATKAGAYELTYELQVNVENMETYLERLDEEAEYEEMLKVAVLKEVTIVTKEDADALIKEEKVVLTTDNVVYATETKETVEDTETEETTNKTTSSNTNKASANKTSSNKSNTTTNKPSGSTSSNSSKPSSGTSSSNSSSSSSGNSSNSGTASKPETSEPVHTHSWEEVTKTESVWVQDSAGEPIYEKRNVCNHCGYISSSNSEAIDHSVDCGYGYSSKKVQVGTSEPTGHYENKTTVTGYKCSCGATK